jgi:diguanylate cyclase (GGDEF)-like protein
MADSPANTSGSSNGSGPQPARPRLGPHLGSESSHRVVVDLGADSVTVKDATDAAADRRSAARDRAAAALDRQAAALDRKRAADYLRRTYRDALTGALRREVGRDRLVEEVDRAERTRAHLTVAFLDVIGLKGVNDEQGHSAGDHLLAMVGQALRDGLRSYDVVVRFGGDEFVCLLPDSSRAEASRRLSEVNATLGTLHPGAKLSVGLASLREGDTADALIERADREMYTGRRKPSDSGGEESAGGSSRSAS